MNLTWSHPEWTRISAVKSQSLAAWSMTRPDTLGIIFVICTFLYQLFQYQAGFKFKILIDGSTVELFHYLLFAEINIPENNR
jgi:hypothetical protein